MSHNRPPQLEQKQEWSGRDHSEGGERMGCYVLDFQEIDQTKVALVGGKGAHLAELSRIERIRVPAGFCGAPGMIRGDF